MLVRTNATRTHPTGRHRWAATPAATPPMTRPPRGRARGGRGVVRHVGRTGALPLPPGSYAVCTLPSSPTSGGGGDHQERVWGSRQGLLRVDPHGCRAGEATL